MLTAQTVLRTDRASRYLIQLCEHANLMGSPRRHPMHGHVGAPARVQAATWSDLRGVITFDGGTCMLEATDATLLIHVAAADADCLQRIKTMVKRRLETIGRRDRFAVQW